MGRVEARSASLPRMGGALAPRVWAYAAALLAAFVLAYAIAASGSDPGPSGRRLAVRCPTGTAHRSSS